MKSKKLRRSRNKKNIRYSGWREIPSGNAPEEITQGCLVLEGGAFRGRYSQGVLDALMENGINQGFISPDCRDLYFISDSTEEILDYLKNYHFDETKHYKD